MTFTRSYTQDNFNEWENKRSTGFRLEWEYFPSFSDNETVNTATCNANCKVYVQLANMIHSNLYSEDEIRSKLTNILRYMGFSRSGKTQRQGEIMKELENKLSLNSSLSEKLQSLRFNNMSNNALSRALKLMAYFEQKENLLWQNFRKNYYDKILKLYSVRKIISIVSAFSVKEKDYYDFIISNLAINYDISGIKQLLKGRDLGK